MSDPQTTKPWNRECVICAHQWQGDDTDNCPACIERVEDMWERNGVGRKSFLALSQIGTDHA